VSQVGLYSRPKKACYFCPNFETFGSSGQTPRSWNRLCARTVLGGLRGEPHHRCTATAHPPPPTHHQIEHHRQIPPAQRRIDPGNRKDSMRDPQSIKTTAQLASTGKQQR
ncbi:hypothetical protein PTTG_26237, partial [Puccinia triticina 1-1 BBBD Race 1]